MEQKYTMKQVVPLPGSEEAKKKQVADMFNRVAHKYDFLNHFFSLGIDKTWRKLAIKSLKEVHPKHILDIATGTGDLAIAALKLNPQTITGVDISEGMLEKGRQKIKEMDAQTIIDLQYGDSESLQFGNDTFDAITCSYGVRNFEHLEAGLKEMYRVLKPGGKVAILEFSKPKKFPFKQAFNFYFRYILPVIGKAVSKDNSAYHYLPESVAVFPEGKDFSAILAHCGFDKVQFRPLTMGVTTLYTAYKSH